ncbi:hypothetical protein MsAm2_01140 [Methanolapillus ohkumae]|uniref:Uncharacterized protein n=1 Tax=Methanolapillus ohkumae TaxID=3028298 RepID=A0AA96V4F9_9EURY|nr:hypothetical protein MsAm2_01140 [Methanosarcinaceae archaeon Am2]
MFSLYTNLKAWSRETKIAALDCAFFILIILMYFFFVLRLFLLGYTDTEIFAKPVFELLLLYTILILIGLIVPGVLYYIFKSKFQYSLFVFFHGSVAFMTALIFFVLMNGFSSFDNPTHIPPKYFLFYSILYVFLYFALFNSIFVLHEHSTNQTNPKKADNDKFVSKIQIVILMWIVFLFGIFVLYYLENPEYIEDVWFDQYLFIPILASLFIFYKIFFKKEVTTRNLGYFPLSVLITVLLQIPISIFSSFFSENFNFSGTLGYETEAALILFIAGFAYILIVWILTKVYLFLKKIFVSEKQ